MQSAERTTASAWLLSRPPVEFDAAIHFDEVGEHAASLHRGERARVPHQDDPPAFLVGESGQYGQFGCGCGWCNSERRAAIHAALDVPAESSRNVKRT